MARQRKQLDDQLADLLTLGRGARTISYSTPAMAALGPTMIEDNAILNEHLSPGAIRLENLDEEISGHLDLLAEALGAAEQDVEELNASLALAQSSMVDIGARLDEAATDLAGQAQRIDDEIMPAINDAAASPITDARMKAGSLTMWPFQAGTVPVGAIAPGAVSSTEIADFSLVAKKFKDDRHRIY